MPKRILTDKYWMRLIVWMPSASAVCVMVLGAIVLLGWQLENKFLYGVIHGAPPMVPNTALGFILSGGSLFLLSGKELNRLSIYTGQLLATGCLLIGMITIIEYLNIIPMVSIDRLLVPIFLQEPFVLRPSPHTSISFTIAGIALFFLGARKTQLMILIQWQAIFLLLITAVVFFGYIYGEISFYAYSDVIGMALHTAIGFFLLALGLLTAKPKVGLMRQVTDTTTAGSVVIRRLFPAILLVPLILGWLIVIGRNADLFTESFGTALLQILSVTVMAIIVYRVAMVVNREEGLKLRAEKKERQLQADLAHVDRLNTMSEMASSVAHEINQPLTAISTYAFASKHLLKSMDNAPQDVLQSLDRISSQADFAADIIRRMRDFARKQSPKKTNAVLNDLITEAVMFVGDEAHSRNVRIQLLIDEHLPKIKLDVIQIEQVLVNIVRNGIESFQTEDVNEKRITIRAYVNKNNKIQMEICDTGPGMDSITLSKIFESFYTTKGTDGMGMGLSISRSIIESHGGQIWAESKQSKGTCFSITLPLEQ